jgi:hypothetical protein
MDKDTFLIMAIGIIIPQGRGVRKSPSITLFSRLFIDNA